MEPKRVRALIGLGILIIIMLIFLISSFIKNEPRIIETETYAENGYIEEDTEEKITEEYISKIENDTIKETLKEELLSENVSEIESTIEEV